MKIYRAVLSYNNGDTNEWCEWYELTSQWYSVRKTAEKHLPELNKIADAMRHRHRNNYAFECYNPKIEEQIVQDLIIPVELNDYLKDLLDTFSYVTYNGPYSISSMSLGVSTWPRPSWYIYLTIGEETFSIHFEDWDNKSGKYSIYPELGENSNYYRYSADVREHLLAICEEYAKLIQPYAIEYNNIPKDLEWEEKRLHENATILKLLRNTHLILTENSVESIKRELADWRALECSAYKESLEKLLPFGNWKPVEYPTEIYGDLANKLREALNK